MPSQKHIRRRLPRGPELTPDELAQACQQLFDELFRVTDAPDEEVFRNELTAAHTMEPGETVLECDASSGGFTVTLPPLAEAQTRVYYIVNNGASNDVTVDGDGSETIMGSATQTLTPGDSIQLVKGSTEWLSG